MHSLKVGASLIEKSLRVKVWVAMYVNSPIFQGQLILIVCLLGRFGKTQKKDFCKKFLGDSDKNEFARAKQLEGDVVSL